MILGIGIDTISVSFFQEILTDPISSFKKKYFTENEIAYCEGQPGHDPVQHYAGRYVAKEAFIKALGPLYKELTADITNFNFCEIEVITNQVSGPQLSVSGKLQDVLKKHQAKRIFVSISHEATHAVAMVVLES